MQQQKNDKNSGSAHSKSRKTKPSGKSRIVDLFLVIVGLAVLIFIGSFAVKFSQGETTPQVEQQVIPVAVRLQMLNGCGTAGVAGRFGKYAADITKPNFIVDIIDERNFESFQQERTLLIARKADPEQAQKLAAKIGLNLDQVVMKPLEDNFLDIDYSLVVGSDYDRYLSRKENGPSKARP